MKCYSFFLNLESNIEFLKMYSISNSPKIESYAIWNADTISDFEYFEREKSFPQPNWPPVFAKSPILMVLNRPSLPEYHILFYDLARGDLIRDVKYELPVTADGQFFNYYPMKVCLICYIS